MGSPHHTAHSHSMPRPHKCSECGKSFAMEWSKKNHETLHKERLKSEKRKNG